MNATSQPVAIVSPCIGVCTLDAAGYCIGCLRTIDEIAQWSIYSPDERARLLRDVLPQRENDRVDH